MASSEAHLRTRETPIYLFQSITQVSRHRAISVEYLAALRGVPIHVVVSDISCICCLLSNFQCFEKLDPLQLGQIFPPTLSNTVGQDIDCKKKMGGVSLALYLYRLQVVVVLRYKLILLDC
ncbi:UNVERIFIED_CONTAM: hypothetical protein K2H54_048559 [Gekko kuhli]